MNMINFFSSVGNYLASATVSISKLIVMYMLYTPSMCIKCHCKVYCSLLKSIDLTNCERAFKYFVTRSRLQQVWSLRQPLCVVSRSFFEIPEFCIRILNVQVTVPPHCRGTYIPYHVPHQLHPFLCHLNSIPAFPQGFVTLLHEVYPYVTPYYKTLS